MQKGLQGVICDWAGTMVDFGSLSPVAAFKEAFKLYNFEVSFEEIRSFMGMLKFDHTKAILELTKERFFNQFGRYPDEHDAKTIYKHFEPALLHSLEHYSKPIRGAVDFAQILKQRNIKLGSTTGYTAAMLEVVMHEASKGGYTTDCYVTPSVYLPGRPHPFMVYKNAIELEIYPLSSILKIGDTISDIHEGLNAGCWSVGVAMSGNELGLSYEEMQTLPKEFLEEKRLNAYKRLYDAGAHYVLDGIWEALPLLEIINEKIMQGEKPCRVGFVQASHQK
ncbi:phosphonoacetaldehyde hydrolase [Sulfurospirillum barnesii]|uniref:Phosphonoacetaldehyde hydrolase n=1 Tax=Sulfurospirillum barnesii (strain ATCC 700032 / DSM 10660 / SES-3) TaxID=760154 RepID=I3XZ84_SULBS|nr:phosphonoacetaldehyde hydrolase [Sulfurospirillum barnesii]AFL69258.1 phosphonoacetaldehyde hydrolase [Sulfurospirillum barnesii SES-3]